MNSNDQRNETDTRPVYNIKAVVEATGLPAATLRAWERRYGALAPGRTDSGYRLYSAQDIKVLRWLKARVEEGLTISQAIALHRHRRMGEPGAATGEIRAESRQGLTGTRAALLAALIEFDEVQADRLLEEAFAVYGLEAVTEHLIGPAMVQIGDRWHRGEVTTAVEHFASNYLRRKIDAIINAAPRSVTGPLVVLGCAPNDWHELGVLLMYLLLRRRGLRILYLGQNVPVLQFVEEMERLRPAIVIIAATTAETVAGVRDLAAAVQSLPEPQPLFAFGGRAFNVQPELRKEIPGIFLGENARSAVEYVVALLEDMKPGSP
jgi:MerR family transcriptional regulator, light-induced transcriptional regulator